MRQLSIFDKENGNGNLQKYSDVLLDGPKGC